LSVRTTLDPKLQVLGRKVLADGLVRYDEAHGWRGPVQRVAIGPGDWGVAMADIPALGDIAPWRLGVVLDVQGDTAKIGMQPQGELSGELSKTRETGLLTAAGIKWTGKAMKSVVSPGDVIYVEPTDGKLANLRLRQIPEISGALVAMDPYTGRVLA